jgi:hypothetical protein
MNSIICEIPTFFLEAANIFFFVFHVCLILFNMFGWISRKTRKWNLITLALTAFSWIVLGYFYGWGYCFLTDWHWDVRESLGYSTDVSSYIRFLLLELTPFDLPADTVNTWTAILFGLAVLLSLYANFGKKSRSD